MNEEPKDAGPEIVPAAAAVLLGWLGLVVMLHHVADLLTGGRL